MEITEAIEIIEKFGIDSRGYPSLKKAVDAVLEYIKVKISQEGTTKDTIPDTISRQSAIDAVDELFKKVVRPLNISTYEYDIAYAQGEIDAYVTAIDTLKTLAPAQPEEDCNTCKHGYFGDACCNNCKMTFPSHYERRTDG